MIFNYLFSSFYIQEKVNLNSELISEYCLSLRQKDSGRFITNYGGWQSNKITHLSSELQPLLREVQNRFTPMKKLLGLKENVSLSIGSHWININGKNNFNIPHIHPFSLMSAVYYAKVPKNSGKLIFENPIQHHDYVIVPDTVENYNSFNSGVWNVVPEENDLLFFPSWLKHWVEPSETEEERISIAFNIQYDNQ
jgi:uncharacterized protein (TIGR02466 family)